MPGGQRTHVSLTNVPTKTNVSSVYSGLLSLPPIIHLFQHCLEDAIKKTLELVLFLSLGRETIRCYTRITFHAQQISSGLWKGWDSGLMLEYLFFWSSLSVLCFSLAKTIPHAFVSSPALWHTRRKAASSTCGWPEGGEVMWDEVRHETVTNMERRKNVCSERKQKSFLWSVFSLREEEDSMLTQMTSREIIKKGNSGTKPALSPAACLHCVYRRGGGMWTQWGWWRDDTGSFEQTLKKRTTTFTWKKWAVLLKHDRFSCFKHLVPGGCFQGKLNRKLRVLHCWQQQQWFIWIKQWKNRVVFSLYEWISKENLGLQLTAIFILYHLLIIFLIWLFIYIHLDFFIN